MIMAQDCLIRGLSIVMIQEYIRAAMQRAKYEIVEGDGSFYGHIEEFPGAWANEITLEACREELESVIEDYILIALSCHDSLPEIDGHSLEIQMAEHA
jgi:predicted RNase H-like HicB family nuclease